MSVNIVANVTTSGNLTASNVLASNVFQFAGPEVLTSSGAANSYKLTVLSPSSLATFNMTLTNPPQGTIIIEKQVIPTKVFSISVSENSNTWTIPASNIAVFSWVLDRWILATIPFISAAGPELYSFTTATFTSGGSTGRNGPIISQARSGLTGTPAPSAWSGTYLNMTTQGIQQWTVPVTGTYTIEATGAAGGLNPGQTEARGARIIGTVSLTQGEILNIVVGQPGTGGTRVNSPGGGGGTFVYRNASTPLIIAGAGAGMRANWSTDAQGQAGQNAGFARSSDGSLNGNLTAYAGQAAGVGAGEGSWQGPNNGYTRYACSGGGAGWLSQGHETGSGAPSFTKFPPSGCGQNGCYGRHVSAAEPFLGGTGSCGEGNNGGFGGGGGGGCEGEGGGAGYTGGAGTWSTNSHGGGGGSYNGGSNQTNTAGYQTGGGYVTITKL